MLDACTCSPEPQAANAAMDAWATPPIHQSTGQYRHATGTGTGGEVQSKTGYANFLPLFSWRTSTLIAAAQQWPLLHVQTQWWVETNQQELHPNRVCGMLKSVYAAF